METKIEIQNEEIIKIAKDNLPKLLAEIFERSYSNPLKDAIEGILKGEEFKKQLEGVVLETYREVAKEVDFKVFVKEAIVNQVVKTLQNTR